MTIDDLDLVPVTEPADDLAAEGLRGCIPVVSCFLDFTTIF